MCIYTFFMHIDRLRKIHLAQSVNPPYRKLEARSEKQETFSVLNAGFLL